MKIIQLLLVCCCICSTITAQNNYLDNYIGNPVTLKTIGTIAEGVNEPRDLDFKPNSNELWVANYGTSDGGTTVIFYNAGLPNQTSQFRKDSHTSHFMRFTSAIAFGDNGEWACASEIKNTASPSSTFMGPGLWSGDTAIFASVFQNNWVSGYPLGSHLDMLHQSPFAMGIAHDSLEAYWVMDGHNENICKYDYVANHSPGYDDHSAGKIWRYTDVSVTRVAGIPSHLVLDKESGWLYFIDGISKQIRRMNTHTGSVAGNLNTPSTANEPLAGYYDVQGATVEVLDTLSTQPCGIEYYKQRLVVSDYDNGDIYIYSTSPSFSLLTTINTNHPGMMGVKVGPDGHIWCVNNTDSAVYRLDVSVTQTDAAVISIDAPNVVNHLPNFYSVGFNHCRDIITPSITIKNTGSVVVTTLDLQYSIDGGTAVSYSWNGSIATDSLQQVVLPASSALLNGSHLLSVEINSVNGSVDAVDLNNRIDGSFRSFSDPATLPFGEDFSAVTFPPVGWNYVHHNIHNYMSRSTAGGFGASTGSMKMGNYGGYMNITGQKDFLITPLLDFSTAGPMTWLTFNVAYARYASGDVDELNVSVSTDCGETWTTVYDKSGSALSTAPLTTSSFTPSASQWRTDSVNLGSLSGNGEVIIMFTSISNFGNNLYVDDILIKGNTTAIENVNLNSIVSVYPNPAGKVVHVLIPGVDEGKAIVTLMDIAGKEICTMQDLIPVSGKIISLPLSDIPAGLYFLIIDCGKEIVTRKLVVE